jgi:hypothetical protein
MTVCSTWPCGDCLRCAAASHCHRSRWMSMACPLKLLANKSERATTAMLVIHTTHRWWLLSLKRATWLAACYERETAVVQYKLSTGFPSWLNGLARQPAPRSEFVLMRVLLATQHFRHWMTPILNMLVDCPAIPYLSAKRHTTSSAQWVGQTHQLREWCHEFYYQAQSWEKPRRIILVVCEQPDDLF